MHFVKGDAPKYFLPDGAEQMAKQSVAFQDSRMNGS